MAAREDAVEATLKDVRAAVAGGLDRAALDKVKGALLGLAAQTDLWGAEDYPEPDEQARQARYMIAQDDTEGLTLYLNVMLPGKKIPPHDHTTWACVAAVSGVEYNTLFERIDDGSVPGKASLKETAQVAIQPGTGVALMPDDIHQVEINGDDAIRHLHMYGRPLETLSGRTTFDLETGTCKPMSIGVKTKR